MKQQKPKLKKNGNKKHQAYWFKTRMGLPEITGLLTSTVGFSLLMAKESAVSANKKTKRKMTLFMAADLQNKGGRRLTASEKRCDE